MAPARGCLSSRPRPPRWRSKSSLPGGLSCPTVGWMVDLLPGTRSPPDRPLPPTGLCTRGPPTPEVRCASRSSSSCQPLQSRRSTPHSSRLVHRFHASRPGEPCRRGSERVRPPVCLHPSGSVCCRRVVPSSSPRCHQHPRKRRSPVKATGLLPHSLPARYGEGGIRTPGTSREHNGFRDPLRDPDDFRRARPRR